ncbi:MAG TPA: helix-turn-helix transcriptional regulator [Candidatus Paceibacterota bacterium]|nr:helix-turn-helix transcriptional regulator [Candidatus Paceibacterota bacterium]
MNKKKKQQKATDFQEYLAKKLKNPEFRKYYEEYDKQLGIAYQILLLRKKKRMSQLELAKKIGTKQSNIARMEAGDQNFSINTLQKIAQAFNKDLKVSFGK